MAKQTANKPAPETQLQRQTYSQFPLVKTNFILMAIAAAMIVIGFALTAGGASTSPDEFNPEVFSARRIIVGPTIAFLGFIFMGVGIMWPCKNKSADQTTDTSKS
ncbi:MAG: DUF3098 domain-containing protein [Firmicutes bacterium]|nr:DUF3098 domain-containing protein [Bacillota bacterium]MCM1402039.1 DUF3098 domain-containing protein [Bacteroides sp.]MCM1476784.1 DUF3098 domain-containing protein [Bacteroides sp.]